MTIKKIIASITQPKEISLQDLKNLATNYYEDIYTYWKEECITYISKEELETLKKEISKASNQTKLDNSLKEYWPYDILHLTVTWAYSLESGHQFPIVSKRVDNDLRIGAEKIFSKLLAEAEKTPQTKQKWESKILLWSIEEARSRPIEILTFLDKFALIKVKEKLIKQLIIYKPFQYYFFDAEKKEKWNSTLLEWAQEEEKRDPQNTYIFLTRFNLLNILEILKEKHNYNENPPLITIQNSETSSTSSLDTDPPPNNFWHKTLNSIRQAFNPNTDQVKSPITVIPDTPTVPNPNFKLPKRV